jgi:phenylacetate-CoA ligase
MLDGYPIRSFLWRTVGRRGGRALLPHYQNLLLRHTLRHAQLHSPFYRRLFAERSIDPAQVRHTGDLHKLGFFTTASDLRHDPWAFLAVPRERIVYVMTSAGTTGKPKMIFLTRHDWNVVAADAAVGMRAFGITQSDVAQILYCYGEPGWMVGPLLQATFEHLGLLIVPAGNAAPIEQQIDMMRTYGTTVLAGTPSYLHRLTEEAQKLVDLHSLHVRMMFLGAEAWSEAFRAYLQKAWGARVFDSYGMTEIGLAGAGECGLQAGLHVMPNLIFEVIDPETGDSLPPGKEGELVVTTLGRQAMPLLRYRTGDIAALVPEERCPCGIPTPRITRIKGRSDDMVCLGTGENLYPEDLDRTLMGIPSISGYQLIIGKQGYKDTLSLQVETGSPSQELAQTILDRLYRSLGFLRHDVQQSQTIVAPTVEFVAPGGLRARSPIKVRKVVDRRPHAVHVEPEAGGAG